MSDKRILVVGGGIAGLSAAAGFAQNGFAVDLIERSAQISDGGGVGLTVLANATRALAEIGVAEACVAHGMGADTQAIHAADGTLTIDLPLPRIGGPKWPAAMGIRRSALHQCLLSAAEKAGVQIFCGVTVDDWVDHREDVEVHFSDGTTKSYMLMVAADGIFSATRRRGQILRGFRGPMRRLCFEGFSGE